MLEVAMLQSRRISREADDHYTRRVLQTTRSLTRV